MMVSDHILRNKILHLKPHQIISLEAEAFCTSEIRYLLHPGSAESPTACTATTASSRMVHPPSLPGCVPVGQPSPEHTHTSDTALPGTAREMQDIVTASTLLPHRHQSCASQKDFKPQGTLNALPIFQLAGKIMQLFKTITLHSGTIKGHVDS